MRVSKHSWAILSAIILLSSSAVAQLVTATIPVGSLPNAVAVNPVTNRVYVADYLGNDITVIDGATNATTRIAANAPVALAVNPITNMIYAVNYGNDTIAVIDGTSNTVTATISAGINPWAIAINPVTNRIFVTNYDNSNIIEINGNNNVAWRIPVGFNPTALAVNAVTNKVYVANNGDGTVSVVDGLSNEVDTISVGSGPCGIAVNPVTNFAYVLNCDSSTVTAIDGTTYDTTSITTGNGPSAIAINPVSNRVYVPNFQDDSVTAIDGSTFNTATIALIPGSGPFAVAVNPASNQIYVMNAYANTATWIDGVSNAATTLPVGATPYAVAINPVTNRIYVADSYSNDIDVIDGSTMGFGSTSTGSNPVALDVNPTTNLLYVANSGDSTVSVIDGGTGILYASVPADSTPSAVVVDPTKNKVYVANRGGNDVTVIDGSSNTSLNIAAHLGPAAIAVNPATQQIYIANHDSNDVTIISGTTYTTSTVPVDAQPCAIAINTSINQIYVANCGGSTVTEIDGYRKTAIPIAVGSNPSAIVVNPAANLIYVANAGSGSVTIIDGVTFLTTQVQVGTQPSALAINNVTNQIYVANAGSQSITVIDGNTNTVKLTLQLGITPAALAVNQASNKIYVTSTNGSNVIVIDVATNTLSTVPAGLGLGALVVNPVSDAIYAVNGQNNTVVGIRESTRALQGYRVLPQPMSGNISNSLPTFTLLATDENNNPIYPITAYWQMDTTQGTWTPAGQHYSSTFYITVPAALPIGPHVLYTYPAQGDVSNPGIDVGTPRVGDIGAYLFNVVSSNQWLSQTINFPNPGSQTYGVAPITLRAMASSGLQIVYRVISGPATVAGSTLTITGAGTVVVLADQPGSGRWAPADPVQVSFTVSPAVLTVSADNKNMPYGGPLPMLTASYSGFVNGDGVGVLTGSPSLTTTANNSSAPGTYPITVTQGTLQAANYTFQFVNGLLTVNPAVLTVTANSFTLTYGQNTPTLTYTITGFLGGDNQSNSTSGQPSLTTTAPSVPPAGNYAITITQGSLTSSKYTFVFCNGSLTVNPAVLTVTADNKSMTYGGTVPTFTYTVTGFVNGDMQNSATSGSPNITTMPLPPMPPSQAITITRGTLSATNYTFVFVNGSLTVNKAVLTVTADNKIMSYGGTVPTFTYTMTGFVNGDTQGSATSGSPNLSTMPLPPMPPSQAITVTQGTLQAANYTFQFVNGILTVNPAVLTVTANNFTITYGQNTPALTYNMAGFLNGDNQGNSTSGQPSLTTTAPQVPPAGNYPITIAQGGLTSSKYTFVFVNGSLTVNQAVLTVTADNKTMPYGGPLPQLTASYSGFVNGDGVGVLSGSPSLTTTANNNSAPGTYPINAAQGTLSAQNYTFTLVNGTLTVTLANAVITTPAKGSQFGSSTVTIGWSKQSQATSYRLYVGSTPGSYDIAALLTPNLSLAVPNIPTDGRTVYVTLFGNATGSYVLQDTATYTAVNVVKAVITAPTKGSALTGSTATFTWSAETGGTPPVSTYTLYVGSTPGAYDIAAFQTPNLTMTVNNIPTDGRTLYVTLSGNAGGVRLQQDTATYTAFSPAAITTPSKGSTLSGYVVTFGWTAETGATSYQLYVGSSPGASDITSLTTSSLNATVSNLPVDGRTVYVTLYGNGGGVMKVQDSATYTAANITKAVITTPSKGSTFSGYVVTLGWTAETGATSYQLYVGSSPGASDIASVTTSSLTTTVSNLPADGRTVYVTLYGNGGGLLLVQDTATYTAARITKAVITAPSKGSMLSGAVVTFGWTAETGASTYQLYVGSSPGASDIAVVTTSSLSATVSNLPVDGRTIYVTLYGNGGGLLLVQDTATYTAASIAIINTPAKGSQLGSNTVTFGWSAQNGATSYRLYVGSTPGAYDIAALLTPNLSLPVMNVPTDGRAIYVTLFGNAGGSYKQQDTATYTAANIVKAVITAPAKGSQLSGSTATFTWSAETGGNPPVSTYTLYVGSTPGAYDIAALQTSNLSLTVSKIPTDGRTLYVTLSANAGGVRMQQDTATYTAFKTQ